MAAAHVISARNVAAMLPQLLSWLCVAGVEQPSRNGPVLRAPGPVVLEYLRPMERVLFCPARDANPFFHLYECVWMLAGRNDAASCARYAKQMAQYADSDGTLNGAYGYRWRRAFGYDQLPLVIEELRRNPASRRCVVQMWDPGHNVELDDKTRIEFGSDLRGAINGSPDVPCNLSVVFDASGGQLDMTVFNRSNDSVLGACGANAVHMSFLQEVVAACVGIQVGLYWQISTNMHAYPGMAATAKLLRRRPIGPGYHLASGWGEDDRYVLGTRPYPIWDLKDGPMDYAGFAAECEQVCEELDAEQPSGEYGHDWFGQVLMPMLMAHAGYKAGYGVKGALDAMDDVCADDWRTAGAEWLARRAGAKEAT